MACPDESQIYAYTQGAVASAERAVFDAHFARCDECRELVSALILSSPARPELAPASTPAASSILDGKYRIEAIIGMGGMGYVARATHLTLREPVAIKILRREVAGLPGATDRFLREARACVRIKSEHVVRVNDTGTLPSGAPYMVMEFLEGADFAELLARRGRLSVVEVVDGLLQAMDAIAEAHALGIVHRDLKPSNLFLSERRDGSPLVKVLDFGISKTTHSDESTLTTGDTLLGSPRYMSPEQMQSTRDVDLRTDIWSLGIIMHELLCGQAPFSAPNTAGLCAAILTAAPPPIRKLAAHVPEGLQRAILTCLAKRKDDRYRSIAALAVDIAPYGSEIARTYAERIGRMSARIRPSVPPLETLPLNTRVRVEPVDPRAATYATPASMKTQKASPTEGAAPLVPIAALPSWRPAPPPASTPRPKHRKGALAVGFLLATAVVTTLTWRSMRAAEHAPSVSTAVILAATLAPGTPLGVTSSATTEATKPEETKLPAARASQQIPESSARVATIAAPSATRPKRSPAPVEAASPVATAPARTDPTGLSERK